MLDIASLCVTQDELRKPSQVRQMIKFIAYGGKFTQKEIAEYLGKEPTQDELVEIAVFPDGKRYVHNGHHRVVAILLGGGTHLSSEEYYVKYWNYSDYNDIVFLNPDGTWRGYVTPLDISTECRLSDFVDYKLRVQDIYYTQSPQHAIHYIRTHPHEYKKPKRFFTALQLSKQYKHLSKEPEYVTS